MKEGQGDSPRGKIPDIWATRVVLSIEKDEEKPIETDTAYAAILKERIGAQKNIGAKEACERIDGAITNLMWHHLNRVPKRILRRLQTVTFAGSEMGINSAVYGTIGAAVGNFWVTLFLFLVPAGPGNVVVPPFRMLADLARGKEVKGVSSNDALLKAVCKAIWENSSSKEVAAETINHVLRACRMFMLRRVHRRVTKRLTGGSIDEEVAGLQDTLDYSPYAKN